MQDPIKKLLAIKRQRERLRAREADTAHRVYTDATAGRMRAYHGGAEESSYLEGFLRVMPKPHVGCCVECCLLCLKRKVWKMMRSAQICVFVALAYFCFWFFHEDFVQSMSVCMFVATRGLCEKNLLVLKVVHFAIACFLWDRGGEAVDVIDWVYEAL